ncbi:MULTISPECIES: MrpH family fimbial adhesin [Serratia]|jgi:hypothetical protein|nr:MULTISPECIES: hypothetical protein [Serratia]RYM60437.1 hypothetical protein BSR03_15675 [Serratia proteamaculans]CAI1174253.1 Uncharacterised protein [Serratia quinivorans]CAI1787543.1 Uncharacterised protein [Serratia proteamaculans]CAI1875370.1 Uncharacterised protein [Serratia quinivorans]CAI1976083.1 Uncharacterised protein [Serratia quinivorans]
MNYYLLVFSLVSGVTSASQYPIVTSVQTKIMSSKTANYTGTFSVMDIGAAADVPVPAGWTVGIAHRHDAFPGGIDVVRMKGASDACDSYGCSIIAQSNMTLGQAAMSAYRKWGVNSFSIDHSGEGNGGECIGFLASATPNSSHWGGAIMPPGSCIYAPPGQDWCKIITPEITFNHGVLSFSDAAGHSRSTQVNINCTVGTTVKLRLLNNESFIDLKNGLRGDIFIEGKPPTVNLKLQTGNNTVNMSDKLSGEIKPGSFYGASVLVIEPI